MREIKFRGKRVDDGEWVYGDLAHNYDSYIKDNKNLVDDLYRGWFKVVDNTVGQYTGLKDRNGREIYEGDFISAYNGRIKGPVIFDKRGLAFGIPNGPNEIYQFSMNFLESKDIEIIGNIYENHLE